MTAAGERPLDTRTMTNRQAVAIGGAALGPIVAGAMFQAGQPLRRPGR